jgi:hypothetical protein
MAGVVPETLENGVKCLQQCNARHTHTHAPSTFVMWMRGRQLWSACVHDDESYSLVWMLAAEELEDSIWSTQAETFPI